MKLLDENKYVKRLFEEWKLHGKIILAVDFDDTVSPWKLTTHDEIQESGILNQIKIAQQTGAYIVAFTACNEDRYQEIKNFFSSRGIVLDGINQNPIELPYGNHSKIYANIFLDDRAGLNEALQILNDAMYMYRGYKEGLKINDQTMEF